MATVAMPSAEIVFDTLFAYQRSAALKSALDLDLFSLIDEGEISAPALAALVGAAIAMVEPSLLIATVRPNELEIAGVEALR